jgi:hypothetical protein
MAANVSRKSRRVIRRFIRSFVGSRGAIARLAEVMCKRIACAQVACFVSLQFTHMTFGEPCGIIVAKHARPITMLVVQELQLCDPLR